MALQEQKLTGLKKRQQIEQASRVMFIWVAVASVSVSFFLVVTQFMYQKWSYNNRVFTAKIKADDTIKKNITNAKALQDNVNALVGNPDLAAVKNDPNDPNTKIVLDALPSTLDTTALATSLQKAILNRSGVTIENIDPGASAVLNVSTIAQPIPTEHKFTIIISGTYDRIHNAIIDLGKSIRPMKVTSISLSGSDTAMRATIECVTYYQPAKTINVKQQVVK